MIIMINDDNDNNINNKIIVIIHNAQTYQAHGCSRRRVRVYHDQKEIIEHNTNKAL